MSLRDQLLKSGLISKEKAQEAEHSKKATNHQAHKNKVVRQKVDAEKKQRIEERQAFDEAKKQMDLEKNRSVQMQKAKIEARIEARRIIDENRVNHKDAEDRFNFCPDGKKIRFVRVTEAQRKLLSGGELAICRNDRDGFDYPLIPKKNANRLQEIEKIEGGRWIYFLIDPNEISQNDDESAAWDAYEAEKTSKTD